MIRCTFCFCSELGYLLFKLASVLCFFTLKIDLVLLFMSQKQSWLLLWLISNLLDIYPVILYLLSKLNDLTRIIVSFTFDSFELLFVISAWLLKVVQGRLESSTLILLSNQVLLLLLLILDQFLIINLYFDESVLWSAFLIFASQIISTIFLYSFLPNLDLFRQ